MLKKKEDRISFLGSAFFVFLFFLFVAAFSQKSDNSTSFHYQYELSSESQANKAVAVNAVQLPSFNKNWLSFTDNLNLQLFNEKFKISSDNKTIHLRIVFLQQNEQSIKPLVLQRFNYYFSCTYTEDLPVLS